MQARNARAGRRGTAAQASDHGSAVSWI